MLTLRDGKFNALRSDEIVVGDLVCMNEGNSSTVYLLGEMFPADIILLASSNDGLCYI